MPEKILHKVTAALWLMDTTNGMGIENETRFLADGRPCHPVPKGGGVFVFLLPGDGPFALEVRAAGFESERLSIDPADFAGVLPLIKLELIPLERYRTSWPCKTLAGVLPGLTGLEAVRLNEDSCLIREYDARRKTATFFNPHRLELERAMYALVNQKELTFETFTVKERLSDKTFKIDGISEGFAVNSPVAPVIRGRVDETGGYLLRARDMDSAGRLLVRLRFGGEERFRTISLSGAETDSISAPDEPARERPRQ